MRARWLATVGACGAGAALAAVGDEPGITAHRLWLFAHLLLFVFWLGADLGVFLCGRAAATSGLAAEQRQRTLELMGNIELAPRIAASLMLTVGGILTEYVGVGHPQWQMAGIVLLGPVWLSLILIGHLRRGTPTGAMMARLEEGLRVLLLIAVPVSVTWSWLAGRFETAPYVAAKLLIFAALLLVGLLARRGPGLQRVADIPFQPPGLAAVIAIWTGLALAAFLGIVQPGQRENPPSPGVAAAVSLEVGFPRR